MKLRQKKKILFLHWILSCAAAPSSITLSLGNAWLDLSGSSPNRFRIKGHFFSNIKLRGTSSLLHHSPLEKASVAHSLKTPECFVQLIAHYCQDFGVSLIPSIFFLWHNMAFGPLGALEFCWDVLWYFAAGMWNRCLEGLSGQTLSYLDVVNQAQCVRSFLQGLQAHVSFTLSSNSPYFPGKPLDSALYEGNYRPLHTFSSKCVWYRHCWLQNLGGRDLSFSLVIYLAYSTVRHQVNNIGNNDADRYDWYCSGDQRKIH